MSQQNTHPKYRKYLVSSVTVALLFAIYIFSDMNVIGSTTFRLAIYRPDIPAHNNNTADRVAPLPTSIVHSVTASGMRKTKTPTTSYGPKQTAGKTNDNTAGILLKLAARSAFATPTIRSGLLDVTNNIGKLKSISKGGASTFRHQSVHLTETSILRATNAIYSSTRVHGQIKTSATPITATPATATPATATPATATPATTTPTTTTAGNTPAPNHKTTHPMGTTRPFAIPATTPATTTVDAHYVYHHGNGGRLGNKMFEYAALFSLASRLNYTALASNIFAESMFPLFGDHLTIDTTTRIRKTDCEHMGEHRYATYDSRYDDVSNIDCNICLQGYFQTFRYFSGYENELRRQFTLTRNLSITATKFLDRVRLTGVDVTTVAVHIRRGDRVYNPHFRSLYKTASVEYIRRAMSDFRRNYSSVRFVVASDSPSWCKLHFNGSEDVHFTSGSVEDDFSVLTSCDHAITTVGTFSWWVGWMTGGVVTYYSDQANHSSYVYRDLNSADYFKPEWIAYDD